MPMFTLHRNFLLRTTKGHTVRFTKDQPTYVPPACVEDAVAIGAQAVNEADGDVLGAEPQEIILTAAERKQKIREAIEVMMRRQERSDFTGNGMPNAKKIMALAGFEVNSKERDSVWNEIVLEQQAQMEQDALDARSEAV
jgi:hypothetical protein